MGHQDFLVKMGVKNDPYRRGLSVEWGIRTFFISNVWILEQ